jgi:L-aspartate oxidase
MKRYNEAQELAPRDIVARAIVSEMHRTNAPHVYLDMTAKSKEFLEKRFPRIYATCESYGLDLATDVAPVCPAAHYMMGGVKTDLWGRTSIPGLYAAGETAATGVHGANRLASNSLLEGLVFGARSGQAMSQDAPVSKRSSAQLPGKRAPQPDSPDKERQAHAAHAEPALRAQIRDLMWRHVGILRNGKDLKAALAQLESLQVPESAATREDNELKNLHSLAAVITRSAIAREESRGSHYRGDFPYRDDDDFQKHSIVRKGSEVSFET